jgi:hypothetical protein
MFGKAKTGAITATLGLASLLGISGCNDQQYMNGQISQDEYNRRTSAGKQRLGNFALGVTRGLAVERGSPGSVAALDTMTSLRAAELGRSDVDQNVNVYTQGSGVNDSNNVNRSAPVQYPSPGNNSYGVAFRGIIDANGNGHIQPQELVNAGNEVSLADDRPIYFGVDDFSRECLRDDGGSDSARITITAPCGPIDNVGRPVSGMVIYGHQVSMMGHYKLISNESKLIDNAGDMIYFEFNSKQLRDKSFNGICWIHFYDDSKETHLHGYKVNFKDK